MSENKKEGKFQNLKQWCQFWRQLKKSYYFGKSEAPIFEKGVN